MAKATRQVAERLAKVDFVIEVRDARVPLSSAAAHLEQLLRDTGRADRKLIAVNKADLVTPEHGKAIASRLGSRARLISTRSGVGVLDLLEDALRAITGRSPRLAPLPRAAASASDSGASSHGSGRAARLSGGSPPRFSGGGGALPLILMVVGAPNTGKSSLINALRRAHAEKGGARDRRRRSRRPARTGPTPGVTRSLSGFQVLPYPTPLPPHAAQPQRRAARRSAVSAAPTPYPPGCGLVAPLVSRPAASGVLGPRRLAARHSGRSAAAPRGERRRRWRSLEDTARGRPPPSSESPLKEASESAHASHFPSPRLAPPLAPRGGLADGTEARRVGPARRSRGRRGAREFLALPARCLTIRLAAPVAEGRSTGRRRGAATRRGIAPSSSGVSADDSAAGAAAGDRPVAAVGRGEPSRLRGTRGRLARRCRRGGCRSHRVSAGCVRSPHSYLRPLHVHVGFGQPAARRARHAHRLRASAPAPTGGGTRPPPARAAGWIIAAARPQTIATVSPSLPSCTYVLYF